MTINNKPVPALLIASAALIASAESSAVDLNVATQLGYGLSDNITRTPTNGFDEDIATVGVNLTLTEQTEKITADVQARADYYDYVNDAFASETLASGNAQLQFRITDTVLAWTVQDTFGQQIINVFDPITPNNRENVNNFSTGPDLVLPFGQRTGLNVGARYTNVDYEFRQQDNERTGVDVQLFRQLSEISRLTLGANGEQIEYDDSTINVDLDIYRYVAGYQITSARTDLSVELGWNFVESDLDDVDGLLVDISLNRRISQRSTISVNLGSEFSEAGNIFQFLQGLNGRGDPLGGDRPPDADIQDTSNPFTNEYVDLAYNFEGQRLEWGISGFWREESFETPTNQDRRLYGALAQVSRQLSRRITLNAYAQWNEREFSVLTRTDTDTQYGAGLTWDVGPRFSLDLNYDFFDRESDVLNADYTENRLSLLVRYVVIE